MHEADRLLIIAGSLIGYTCCCPFVAFLMWPKDPNSVLLSIMVCGSFGLVACGLGYIFRRRLFP